MQQRLAKPARCRGQRRQRQRADLDAQPRFNPSGSAVQPFRSRWREQGGRANKAVALNKAAALNKKKWRLRRHPLSRSSQVRNATRPGLAPRPIDLGPRGFALLIALALGLGLFGRASAAAPGLATLQVQLWPEYDRPATLVMLEAQVAATATLPTVIKLKIPASAGTPHAVAKLGADRKLYVAAHTRTVEGEWATIAVTTDRPVVRVEYYGVLDRSQALRRYRFELPDAPAIDMLMIEVQTPLATKKLELKPAAEKMIRGPRGFMLQALQRKALAAGTPLQLELSYLNPSGALSVALLPNRASAAVPPAAQSPAAQPPRTRARHEESGAPKPQPQGIPGWLWIAIAAGALVGMGAAVWRQRRVG